MKKEKIKVIPPFNNMDKNGKNHKTFKNDGRKTIYKSEKENISKLSEEELIKLMGKGKVRIIFEEVIF